MSQSCGNESVSNPISQLSESVIQSVGESLDQCVIDVVSHTVSQCGGESVK